SGDLGVEPVEIGEVGHVTLHCGDTAADKRYRLVQFCLAAPGDVDERAFFDEALGGGCDEVRGSLRVSCPPQLPHILGPGPMTTSLSRYPLVRVQLHLSNRRVDLINERYDVAFRIRSNFETDQSLTLRNLGCPFSKPH